MATLVCTRKLPAFNPSQTKQTGGMHGTHACTEAFKQHKQETEIKEQTKSSYVGTGCMVTQAHSACGSGVYDVFGT
jgi:hypothetical protein